MFADLFYAVQSQILNAVGNNSINRFVSIEFSDFFDPSLLVQSKLDKDICVFFERPAENFTLVGIGTAKTLTNKPGHDLTDMGQEIKRIFQSGCNAHKDYLTPKLLGGFRFNNSRPLATPWESFGEGQLILPKLLFVRSGSKSGVIIAPDLQSHELLNLLNKLIPKDNSKNKSKKFYPDNMRFKIMNETNWSQTIPKITKNIRNNRYEKVVLAASIALSLDKDWNFNDAFNYLRMNYSECFLFHMNIGEGVFFGASPELLVRLTDDGIETAALAASIGRGDNLDEDRKLATELLSDPKSKLEHQLVINSIVEKLNRLDLKVNIDSTPKIRKLQNIQHLLTPIYAEPTEGLSIIDLVDQLHPTPAVCGYPEYDAREIIDHYENFDRGWYAGPVGWVDANGKGEFAVALRSCLIAENIAWLFAGNGIVADSNVDDELEELLLKFQPLSKAIRHKNPVNIAYINPFESNPVRV
tara:strand:- start:4791 stop:6200 length:1410 start_codon:yes stop_codon:yes gene_type:complete